MPLVIVAVAVVLLVFLMTKFKLNGFVALLIVSALVGIFAVATGTLTLDGETVGLAALAEIITDGLGGQMASTMIVVGLGAMIGRVMGDAGAAQRIALKIVGKFGVKGVQWAMVITAIVVGITMFYEVAFVVVVPVAFTLVRATNMPLLWVGLPMSITMSTMHSFLPPHPGPVGLTPFFRSGGSGSRPVARGCGQGDWSDHVEHQEASHPGAGRPQARAGRQDARRRQRHRRGVSGAWDIRADVLPVA